jgi:hypothetical protein
MINKFVSGLQNTFTRQDYKSWEKVTMEAQMNIKSYVIEWGILLSPLILANAIWSFWVMIKTISLPYGQSYNYFNIGYWMLMSLGIIGTFITIKKLRPYISQHIQIQKEKLTTDIYVKGAKFTDSTNFNQKMKQYTALMFERHNTQNILEYFKIPINRLDKDDKRYEINVEENILIPKFALSTGLCIIGAPGTGKGVLLSSVVNQIKTIDKTIIVDVKGEFLEKFYDPRNDIIICPSDLRSNKVKLTELVDTQVSAGSLAEILVPEDKTTTDPHWVASARLIMEAVLLYGKARQWSNEEVFMAISNQNILMEIQRDPEVSYLISNLFSGNESRELKSVLTTLMRKSRVIQYLSYTQRTRNETIRLDKWLNNKKGGKLFLLSNDELLSVFAPFYGSIIGYLIRQLLKAPDQQEQRFYFILDELPQLGKTLGKNLQKALAVGRSKGFNVAYAMQSYSQLKSEFGQDESEAILDTTNSIVTFKTQFSGEFISKLYGQTTIKRPDESVSMGMESMSDRITINMKEVKENLIDGSEFKRLASLEFYAMIEGCEDVLKTKLAPKFIQKNGTLAYVENPDIQVKLADEMNKYIKRIETSFINFRKVKILDKEASRVCTTY